MTKTPGAIYSHAVYKFDLDNRRLRIEDYDAAVPEGDVRIRHSFRVKVISKDAVPTLGPQLRVLKGWKGTIEESLKDSEPLSSEIADSVICGGEILLRIHRALIISPKSPLMLRIYYEVPLRGEGDRLVHPGAMQPSDLAAIREWLELKEVVKRVRISAYSWKRSFIARVVDGSNLISYPTPVLSKRLKCHVLTQDLEIRLGPHWMRAAYFALEVEWGAMDPIDRAPTADMDTMLNSG